MATLRPSSKLSASYTWRRADGSVTIQFGGCGNANVNCIPIVLNWNYTVRLYRPRKQVLDGTWAFSEAQPG